MFTLYYDKYTTILYVILKYPIYISSTESNVPHVEQEPSVCGKQMYDDGLKRRQLELIGTYMHGLNNVV